ncbi:MAG: hypothetical protein ACFFFT_10615 [Candidatus Thorarchaeota archaeon]
MKSLLKRILASLLIIILGLSIGLGSFFFLIGQEEKKKGVEEEEFLGEIKATVLKEDGYGGWAPVNTSGEIINGYINFTCTRNNTQIDTLELFLTNYLPHLVSDPIPENWSLIQTYNDDKPNYSYVINSRTLPDEETWYFFIRAVTLETEPKVIFSNYSIPFRISHFNDSISFNYLDTDGRINYNSHIAIIPFGGYEDQILTLDLYVNYTNDITFFDTLNYFILSSNYWLIDLDLLEAWAMVRGLLNNEIIINFIIEANFIYGPEFSKYSYNYTLDSIILDTKGPNINVDAGTSPFGYIYSDPFNSILTVNITCSDTHFSSIELEYKYETKEPGTEIWRYVDTYTGNIPFVLINFNIQNMKDDKIYFRFIGYDDLGNSRILDNSSYWIIKDMNNHEDFIIVDLYEKHIYPLDQASMIDINVTIYPFDNDITRVSLITLYEVFQLTDMLIEEDYIYFTDHGSVDTDIKLNSAYYSVIGQKITAIPLEIYLYQGPTLISIKTITIYVTDSIFESITISNLEVDAENGNISMSFNTTTNAYNNSHNIPYIANNRPPVIKIRDSNNITLQEITLRPKMDENRTEIYNYGTIEILNNRFFLPNPSMSLEEDICSVDQIIINVSSLDFNYFIFEDEIYIILLTTTSYDGIYGTTNPIIMDYGITNRTYITSQYNGFFNFTSLPENNYTMTGEFYDITGKISMLTINKVYSIDFEGPKIFKQFLNGDTFHPERDSLSFLIRDFSGIATVFFNTSINGSWSIEGDLYTFYLNDSVILEGLNYCTIIAIDTLGYFNDLDFMIFINRDFP